MNGSPRNQDIPDLLSAGCAEERPPDNWQKCRKKSQKELE